MAKPSGRPIREELLASASTLIQRVGVNGFSYAALADELGIAAPSIHHHFRTKGDLIGAVVARYRADFAARVDAIDSGDAVERIVAFAELFDATANRESLCLCGSVASDWLTVGDAARSEVHAYFGDQVAWLSSELTDAMAAGAFPLDGHAAASARMLLAMLEGSMLLSRTGDDEAMPSTMARQFLQAIRR